MPQALESQPPAEIPAAPPEFPGYARLACHQGCWRPVEPSPPAAHLCATLTTSCLGLRVMRWDPPDCTAGCPHLSQPWPLLCHLQPGFARNSLGLLPSTHGLQPRVLPRPLGPCPGPCRGTKVGAGEGPAERMRHHLGQWGAGTGGGSDQGRRHPPLCGSLFAPYISGLRPVATSAFGALPCPLFSLTRFSGFSGFSFICSSQVSSKEAFRAGGWGWGGNQEQREGIGGEAR